MHMYGRYHTFSGHAYQNTHRVHECFFFFATVVVRLKIEVETGRGVLRVVGHPAAVEELYARAVKLLSEALPAFVQWVSSSSTMRHATTPKREDHCPLPRLPPFRNTPPVHM